MSGYGMAASGAKLPFAKSNSRAISEAGGRGARSLFSDRHELSLVLTVAHGLALLLPLWLKLILGVSNLSKWLARSIGYPWQSRSAAHLPLLKWADTWCSRCEILEKEWTQKR